MKTKGVLQLLEAFRILLERNPTFNIHLTLAGDYIQDYLATEKEIKKSFLQEYNNIKRKYPDRINYLGSIEGNEKKEVLSSSDIFVLPTIHVSEAFPISIIEALRAGNYIIATRHNYIPEIISDKNGELIQTNSVDDIYNALKNIVEDNERLNQIQDYNIKYAKENYNAKTYLLKVIDIISKYFPPKKAEL